MWLHKKIEWKFHSKQSWQCFLCWWLSFYMKKHMTDGGVTRLLYNALYCTVLYCTVLYCTLLYSTVLYSTVLYSTLLYSTLLYCTVLYCTLLYSTLLYSTLLHSTVYKRYLKMWPLKWLVNITFTTMQHLAKLWHSHSLSHSWSRRHSQSNTQDEKLIQML